MQHKYVDPCYLIDTWEFLDGINNHIHLEPDTWICPQCKGDSFIIEDLTNLPGLKPIELVHAQQCRLSWASLLWLIYAAPTSNGQEICERAINGYDLPQLPIHRFPHQDKPSNIVWASTWQKVLHCCYAMTREGKLDNPLGK